MKILSLVQGSDEWKAERKKWVTASEMAAVLGIKGAFCSRKKLLRDKLSTTEKELSAYTLNMFARGHLVEQELTAYAADQLGMPFESSVILDEKLGIIASVDNINFEYGVVVETKNSGAVGKLKLAAEGIVWEPYRVQILTQMLVANVKIGFMCMRDELTNETFMVPVKRDDAMVEQIIKESAKFLEELRNPPTTHDTQLTLCTKSA